MSRRFSNLLGPGRTSGSASRREFLSAMGRSALVLPFSSLVPGMSALQKETVPTRHKLANIPPAAGFSFTDISREAGLSGAVNVFGGVAKKQYILEETGCGVALCDYDNDGWLDIFLVNGTRLEGFPPDQAPTNRLFKNNRDGTFSDVTTKAGLIHSGWGQGVCIGDYDNDGYEDLFVAYFGKNVLYHNNGDGTFTDVTE